MGDAKQKKKNMFQKIGSRLKEELELLRKSKSSFANTKNAEHNSRMQKKFGKNK